MVLRLVLGTVYAAMAGGQLASITDMRAILGAYEPAQLLGEVVPEAAAVGHGQPPRIRLLRTARTATTRESTGGVEVDRDARVL